MSSEAYDQHELLQAIESLRADVSRLSDRVAALEGLNHGPRESTPPGAAHQRPPSPPVVDEALICVISAAVAAYLGVQPRIRQIRLVGGTSWAQQGRVYHQA